MSEDQESGISKTPPYVSFKSFLTLIEDLKTNQLPPQIDRSVLKRFSGGLGSQLLVALRSLALVNEKNEPTPTLKSLVDTFGSEQFKSQLHTVISSGYPFLSKLDLKTATQNMFAEAFKNGTAAKEDVLRKCRTFYIHAAQYSGIELGSRLTTGSSGPRNGTGTRKRSTKTSKPETETSDAKRRNEMSHKSGVTMMDKLLDKFPTMDPTWPDEIKAKWFEGFQKLMESVDNPKK